MVQEQIPTSGIDEAYDYNYDDEYAFWDDTVKHIDKITHNIWPKINQWMNTKSKSACTIFWARAQIIRLFWLDLSREDANKYWLDIIDYCTKKWWYIPWKWWWTPTACNYVCKWWNEIWCKTFKKEKVFYLRVYYTNPLVKECLDKWHMVWYTKQIQFWIDQANWYVYRDSYPSSLWHRLNLKWPDYIPVATWWAKKWNAKWWSQDNYFEQTWTNFYIEDLSKYINKGIYAYVYIILPESAMTESSVEQEKQNIEEEKAVNALIWTLSTTWWSLPEIFQEQVSELASNLRKAYPNARQLVWDENKKHYQAVADNLSFNYKWWDEKFQEAYAILAKEIRTKNWVL